jgi:hypothetical protein
MPTLSHTFDGPLAALEGVAQDGTARYVKNVYVEQGGVVVIFTAPQNAYGKKVRQSDRYAAFVAGLNKGKPNVGK